MAPPMFSMQPQPDLGVAGVVELETRGWNIATFGDAQIKYVDPYVRAAASIATAQRIRFRISVTNPITRDSSVTATAAASLQLESGGRLVLGIGAGYTALSLIGLPYPAKFPVFENYVREVRAYLHGQTVDRHDLPTRLRWLPDDLPRVPIDITASGPRGLRLAGEVADWVTLAVGAHPGAIEQALATVREGAHSAGRDMSQLTVGIHVPAAIDEDADAAIGAVRNTVATMAGFGVIARPDATPVGLTAQTAQLLRERMKIVREGDLSKKKQLDSVLSDDYIGQFALAGTASDVSRRIRDLSGMGIDYVNVVFGSDYADPARIALSRRNFEDGVIASTADATTSETSTR